MDDPFELTLYDRNLAYKQTCGGYEQLQFTPRWLAQPSGQIVISEYDAANEFLLAKGARYRLTYRGEQVSSGKVRSPTGTWGPASNHTYQLQDDYRWLGGTQAWVRPDGPLEPTSIVATSDAALGQAWLAGASDAGANGTVVGQQGYYPWPASALTSVEAAVKHLIGVNFDRLNRSRAGARRYTMAPSSGRGGDPQARDVVPDVRFGALVDPILALLDGANLGLRLAHEDGTTTVLVDVFTPRTIAQELTYEAGTITGGTWSINDPNATRGVVGGPGDIAARAFREFRSTAVEDEEGDVIEVFREATDAPVTWPSTLDESLKVPKYYPIRSDTSAANRQKFLRALDKAGAAALAEGAPTSGLSITLSETPSFRYGPGGFHVGDLVTARKGNVNPDGTLQPGALRFSSRITEATLAISPENGVTVTSTVGERKDDPLRATSRAIVRLAASQKRQATRR